jgi:uncharacterized protein (DUF4415 family)
VSRLRRSWDFGRPGPALTGWSDVWCRASGALGDSDLRDCRRSPGDPLAAEQKANIEELLAKPNRKVDTSDIPELPADAWKNAVRGRFYRPLKEAVSLRLDADVLAWLKKDGQGYQTRVNRMLRERMLKNLEGR